MQIAQISLVLLASIATLSHAFRWHLHETVPADKFFTFSERFMFATGNGPVMLEQGASFINTNIMITTLSNINTSLSVGFAVFATEESMRHHNLDGLCGNPDSLRTRNTWAMAIESELVQSTFNGVVNVYDPILRTNTTKYSRTAEISHKYSVRNEMWHNVVFLLCSSDGDEGNAVAELDGLVAFRNPYGYIPAELYGILPFEGARMVAYVLFSCYFAYHYHQNRESVLPLHNAFLLVFLFALAEATLWYATYQSLNLTGEPYCCPFPPTVVGSLVLQIFRQTFSRTLLLVVCLGYGIVRPKLMSAEWTAITIVSVLYFVAATVAQVSDIILVQDGAGDPSQSESSALAFKAPELFMDVVFLSWIYLAIGSTIRILTEFNQTVKLRMYQQLVFIIGVFAGLFTLATVTFLLDDAEYISWPWQWAWVQQVLWESLNFAVLAAVCFICKPTENSRLLSYASQLPTEDPDEDDDEDGLLDGPEGGDIEMHGHRDFRGKQQVVKAAHDSSSSRGGGGLSYSRRSDEDHDHAEDRDTAAADWDSVGAKTRGENSHHTQARHKDGFESLPDAEGDEEEDYGLHD